jgi:hypothetical protein
MMAKRFAHFKCQWGGVDPNGYTMRLVTEMVLPFSFSYLPMGRREGARDDFPEMRCIGGVDVKKGDVTPYIHIKGILPVGENLAKFIIREMSS